MIISDLEFFRIAIPCSASAEAVSSVLVRLATPSGREGWGEAALPWRAEELPERREALLPALSGRSVFNIEDLLHLEVLRNASLCWAVETACWDLIGKIACQPLCRLIGGEYRHWVPAVARIPEGSVVEQMFTIRDLAAQGIHWQTIPLEGKLEEDLDRVRVIEDTVGRHVEIRWDAGGRYLPEEAREFCAAIEELGPGLVIDPTDPTDFDGFANLQAQTVVSIGVRRAIRAPRDVMKIARSGSPAFLILDPEKIGSMLHIRKCAAIAEAAGFRVSLGSPRSVGITSAALLQLASAVPTFACGNESSRLHMQDDVFRKSLTVADGMMTLPIGPGLGVEIDREKIDRYLVT